MAMEAKVPPSPTFNEWTSLTPDQQHALDAKKLQSKNENDNYISKHPELRLIIAMFLKRAMDERPTDILRMASKYFTNPVLRQTVQDKTTQDGLRQLSFIRNAHVASKKEQAEMEARVLKRKQQRANTKARAGRRNISRRQSLNMFRAMDKTGDGNLNYLEIKRHLEEVSRSFGIRLPFSAKDFWKMADTDGDKLVNPIEFHVLVNRLQGAMEGAKDGLREGISEKQWDAGFESEMARIKATPFDWLTANSDTSPIPSYGADLGALNVPAQAIDNLSKNGVGVIGVLSARNKDGAVGHSAGALCNAMIRRGWLCAPVVYSDSNKETLISFLNKCDGVLLRLSLSQARAGNYQNVSVRGLKEVLSRVGRTKPVMQQPQMLLTFGSKGALPALATAPKPADPEKEEDDKAPPPTSFGLKGSVVHTDAEKLLESLAKNLQEGGNGRVVKILDGTKGNGVSVVQLTTLTEEVDENTPVSVTNAADGVVMKFTLREFVDVVKGSLPVLEQPFLSRVAEGEVRINMVGSTPVGLVKKVPADGGVSATSGAGAKYTHLPIDSFSYASLLRKWRKELPAVASALGLKDVTKLPLVWTADLLGVSKADDGEEEEAAESEEEEEEEEDSDEDDTKPAKDKKPEPLFKTPPSRYALVDVNCDCVTLPEDNHKLLDVVAAVVVEKCSNYMVR